MNDTICNINEKLSSWQFMHYYSIDKFFKDNLSQELTEFILSEYFNSGDSIYFNTGLTEIEIEINRQLNDSPKIV